MVKCVLILAHTVIHTLVLGARMREVWSVHGPTGAFVSLFTCGGELLFARVRASVGLRGKDNAFRMALHGKLNNLCIV